MSSKPTTTNLGSFSKFIYLSYVYMYLSLIWYTYSSLVSVCMYCFTLPLYVYNTYLYVCSLYIFIISFCQPSPCTYTGQSGSGSRHFWDCSSYIANHWTLNFELLFHFNIRFSFDIILIYATYIYDISIMYI